jgi:hypothetical protein
MTNLQITQFLRQWYLSHNYPHAAASPWEIIKEHPNPEKLVEYLKGLK